MDTELQKFILSRWQTGSLIVYWQFLKEMLNLLLHLIPYVIKNLN